MNKPSIAVFLPEWMPEEPLAPELERWTEDDPFGKMVRHPLIVSLVPGIDGPSRGQAWANIHYRGKLAEVRKLRRAERFEAMMWMFERPFRLKFLVRYKQKMLDSAPVSYWRALRGAWSDAEWPSRMGDDALAYLLYSRTRYPRGLMLKEERAVLKGLPKKVEVFRGVHKSVYRESEDRGKGWCWTLSKRTAQFFATRFSTEGAILRGAVNKEDIIFFGNSRNEQEVVAPPSKVDIIEVTPA